MSEPETIFMTSGVNQEGKPFVRYTWQLGEEEKMVCQWTPEEAKQHALGLLKCAEAADHDAAVFSMLINGMEFDLESAAKFIAELRNHRREQ